LAAARTEFLRSGYAATTIRAVAVAAGVSVATVELVFGTKTALLQAAISFSIRGDGDSVPMLHRDWAVAAASARSVTSFLEIVGRVLVDSAQRSAGLVVAAFEAAAQDAPMRALAEQLRAQRAETAAWIVDGVIARATLRPGIGRGQAVDTVWLLMDPRVFCAATHDRGWDPGRFAQWFADGVDRLLLAADRPPASTPVRRSGSRSSTTAHGPKSKERQS
jgi:AcrR family transcriptional regulator